MFSFLKKLKYSYILILILLFFCGSSAFADYDAVLDEITNSHKSSLYNMELNAPFSKDTSGILETVNPETGALSTNINLFSLQGRGGVESYSIALTYSTQGAIWGRTFFGHKGMVLLCQTGHDRTAPLCSIVDARFWGA